MKSIISAISAAVILCGTIVSFTGCDLLSGTSKIADPQSGDPQSGDPQSSDPSDDTKPEGYKDKWAYLIDETPHDLEIIRDYAKYGEHTYFITGSINYDFESEYYDQEVNSVVTFSNIPSGYTEFQALYEGYLGKTLEGTVAMVPMAMEIFARDPATGEECFNLLCKDEATVKGILRILKSKFPTSEEMEKDSYCQRYLPAALLAGADYTNDYSPSEPYQVECGAASTKPQDTKMAPYGTVYYTYIFADGWESRARSVDIFLPLDSPVYKVQGCSSCYVQCRTIMRGPWNGLK